MLKWLIETLLVVDLGRHGRDDNDRACTIGERSYAEPVTCNGLATRPTGLVTDIDPVLCRGLSGVEHSKHVGLV